MQQWKEKWGRLSKPVRASLCTIGVVVGGVMLFNLGLAIGEAVYLAFGT